jgi:hypothetical protein
MPNRGFTSLVSLPNSSSHSVLFRAVSAEYVSLNLITYPVFVAPTPATWTSLVLSVFIRAALICALAASDGRYLASPSPSLLPSPRVRRVLIRTHVGSFRGCDAAVLGSRGLPVATTSAHDLVGELVVDRASTWVRRARTSSRSSAFSDLISWMSALADSIVLD